MYLESHASNYLMVSLVLLRNVGEKKKEKKTLTSLWSQVFCIFIFLFLLVLFLHSLPNTGRKTYSEEIKTQNPNTLHNHTNTTSLKKTEEWVKHLPSSSIWFEDVSMVVSYCLEAYYKYIWQSVF